MTIALACIATFAVAFVLGAAFGVWLDNTKRIKPINIGASEVFVGTTDDPTELCLIDPSYQHQLGAFGRIRKVRVYDDEFGMLLARIRIANANGAWMFQRAIERAVEAAALKEDGGAE